MEADVNKSIILRLRRIEGQVRGIQRMIEEEADCADVLNQITAIKSAINHVGILLFESHAKDCIYKALHEEETEERFDEIIKMMGRLVK